MTSPIGPGHLYDIVGVSDPAISPDGERVAFVRSWVERKSGGKAEPQSQVMMALASGGETIPFTAGPKDSRPRFSPDGSKVAFLRRDEKKRGQIWVISTAGGEAGALCTLRGGVSDFEWSPDSSALVVVSDVDPDQKQKDEKNKDAPSVRVARRIRYREDVAGWRGDTFRQLFIVDVPTGEARQITSAEGDHWSPAWSPDRASIAYISDVGDSRDFTYFNGVYVRPPSGGEAVKWSEGLTNVEMPAWSPDGSRLAVIGSEDPEADASAQGWLYILEAGRSPRRLTDDSIKPQAGYGGAASSATDFRWTEDGRLLLLADARSESHIYRVSVEDGTVSEVAGGDGQWSSISFATTATSAAAVLSTSSSPSDLYAVDMRSGTTRRVTDYNVDYFGSHVPATLERVVIDRGGLDIESRLFLPPDFDPSGSYPLVLTVHGGPHNAYYDDFNAQQQVLATNGYLVLAVNSRGSSSYGVDFMKAVQQDWGGEDFLDILDAVDQCRVEAVRRWRSSWHHRL